MYLKTQNKILKGKASLYFCIGQLPPLQLQLYGDIFSRLENILQVWKKESIAARSDSVLMSTSDEYKMQGE